MHYKHTGYGFWNTRIATGSTAGLEKIHFWFIIYIIWAKNQTSWDHSDIVFQELY